MGYLFGMRDPRRYRECIKKYLSDCLDITLEERQYTMTTYDDTWSCNVEEMKVKARTGKYGRSVLTNLKRKKRKIL